MQQKQYKRHLSNGIESYTKAMHKFKHPTPRRAQYAPQEWTDPNCGDTKQLANPLDTSPPTPDEYKRSIQIIVITLPYYACDVE